MAGKLRTVREFIHGVYILSLIILVAAFAIGIF